MSGREGGRGGEREGGEVGRRGGGVKEGKRQKEELKVQNVLLNAEVEYPCLSGERHHLPCINFKDSARPAELPRWLSWYSICLEHRRSRVRVPPEAALLFLWKKKSRLRVSLLAFALSL